MIQILKISFRSLLFLLLLSSCAPKASGSQNLIIDKADYGHLVELKPGDTLTVTLDGNPTTGFNWENQPPADPNVLKQIGEPEFKPESNAAGAGGIITINFLAVQPGDTDLTLIYHRSWEKSVPPAKTYQVKVKVTQ